MLKKFGRGKNEMEEHKEKIELEQGGKWLKKKYKERKQQNHGLACFSYKRRKSQAHQNNLVEFKI